MVWKSALLEEREILVTLASGSQMIILSKWIIHDHLCPVAAVSESHLPGAYSS